MSERRVRVILEAVVGQFRTGMAQARQSTTGLTQAAGRSNAMLTVAKTGMVALGFAAVRELKRSAQAAIEFEAAMTKMVSLVGIAREQVQAWTGDFRRLGPAVGATQVELADAMFFITSAGLRGADAMDVLEASAKAAKAGLGEITTVADAATSAMNAYGAENLSASDAVDVLVATAREGKTAPEELAGTLGKVIPMAAELGITFDQVGASIAVMTRTGLGAAEAATALRGIMSTLIKPTNEAEEALRAAGLSMAQLRDVAAGDAGLLGVLQLLDTAFDGNVEAMGEIVPNVRALTGVLNILGQDAGQVAGVFDAVADSAGDTERAFDEWSASSGAAVDRFTGKLSAMRTQTGEDLSGMVAGLADFGSATLDAVAALDVLMRNTSGSAWDNAVGTLNERFDGGTLAAARFERENERLAASFEHQARRASDAAEATGEAAGSMGDAARAADELNSALAALSDPFLNLHRRTEQVDGAQRKYNEAVAEHGRESGEAKSALLDLTGASFDLLAALNDLDEAQRNGESSATQMKAAVEVLAEALGWSEEQADAAKAAIDQVQRTADDLDGTSARVDVLANTDDAVNRVERFRSLLASLPRQLSVNLTAQMGGQIRDNHDGGFAGTGPLRRFHGGGLAGDEILAVLQRGEWVTDRDTTAKWLPLLASLPRLHDGGLPFDGRAVGGVLAGAAGGSSSEIAAAVEEVRRLVEAWGDAVAAQEHAERRLDLLARRAEAERRLAEAATAEERAVAQQAVDEAVRAVQQLDVEHARMGRRREIDAQVAAALDEQRVAANRERFEFDRMSADQQIAWLDERLAGEREFSDEWMRLHADRERIAGQAHAEQMRRLEEQRREAERVAQERAREADAALADLNRLLDQQAAVRERIADREARQVERVTQARLRAEQDIARAVDERRRALAPWAPDQRPSVAAGHSATGLAANIERQAALVDEWRAGVDELRARGLADEAFDLLGLDSPEAVGQIRRLLAATEPEIARLNDAVLARNRQAARQAAAEAKDTQTRLGRDLADIRQGLHDELAGLQAEFNADMAALRAELRGIGVDTGRDWTTAIREGVESGLPGIDAAVAQVRAAMASLAKAKKKTSGATGGAPGPGQGSPSRSKLSKMQQARRDFPGLRATETSRGQVIVWSDEGAPIRTYHSGGRVPGGGDQLAVLQGGEHVLSRSQAAAFRSLLGAGQARGGGAAPPAPGVLVVDLGEGIERRFAISQDRHDRWVAHEMGAR